MTENFEGSSVITDAERGPWSKIISPKYSPGPWVLSSTSFPSSSARYALTLPDKIMKSVSLRSPSLTMTVFFGYALTLPRSESALRCFSDKLQSGVVSPDDAVIETPYGNDWAVAAKSLHLTACHDKTSFTRGLSSNSCVLQRGVPMTRTCHTKGPPGGRAKVLPGEVRI